MPGLIGKIYLSETLSDSIQEQHFNVSFLHEIIKRKIGSRKKVSFFIFNCDNWLFQCKLIIFCVEINAE